MSTYCIYRTEPPLNKGYVEKPYPEMRCRDCLMTPPDHSPFMKWTLR